MGGVGVGGVGVGGVGVAVAIDVAPNIIAPLTPVTSLSRVPTPVAGLITIRWLDAVKPTRVLPSKDKPNTLLKLGV